MHIERFFVPGLAHASYLLASGDEAVVVDPERNVDGYLAYLARNKLKLNGIFLTHPRRFRGGPRRAFRPIRRFDLYFRQSSRDLRPPRS